jgi:hypothetical protein
VGELSLAYPKSEGGYRDRAKNPHIADMSRVSSNIDKLPGQEPRNLLRELRQKEPPERTDCPHVLN